MNIMIAAVHAGGLQLLVVLHGLVQLALGQLELLGGPASCFIYSI